MKIHKKKIIVLCIAFIFVFIMYIMFAKNIFAAQKTGYRLVSNITDKVTPGNQIEISVRLNANDIESFQGTLIYSNALKLISYSKNNEIQFNNFVFNPEIENNKSENPYKENKALSFAGLLNDTLSGDNIILTLRFDTSLCQKGKEYGIAWNNDKSICGDRTYILKGGEKVRLEETIGFKFSTVGNPDNVSDDNSGSSTSEIPGYSSEGATNGSSSEGTVSEDTKNLDEKNNNVNQDDEKGTNSNADNKTVSNSFKKESYIENSETTKSENKLPKTGEQSIVIITTILVLISLIVISGIIYIKKFKQIK